MGTRAIVKVKDGKTTLVAIYRQYDGYPTGLGEDIKKALNDGAVEILNGFSGASKAPAQFNGMGCLAAYLVGALKEGKIGNVYIVPANTKDVGEEYIYTLNVKLGTAFLNVKDAYANKTLFDGPLSEFNGEVAEGKTPLEVELT